MNDKNILLSEDNILLHHIKENMKHRYERGFRCINCKEISDYKFKLHNASIHNMMGGLVCSNCGSEKQWEDIRIKTIWGKPKKFNFTIIEEAIK